MTAMGATAGGLLSPGAEVEVRVRYEEHWTAGFRVDAVFGDRYRLRRRSDNAVLPVTFRADDVRPRGYRQDSS